MGYWKEVDLYINLCACIYYSYTLFSLSLAFSPFPSISLKFSLSIFCLFHTQYIILEFLRPTGGGSSNKNNSSRMNCNTAYILQQNKSRRFSSPIYSIRLSSFREIWKISVAVCFSPLIIFSLKQIAKSFLSLWKW